MPWIKLHLLGLPGAAYRYDPREVRLWLDKKNNLQMEIKGLWCRTIFWKGLFALASEVYFEKIDTNWTEDCAPASPRCTTASTCRWTPTCCSSR